MLVTLRNAAVVLLVAQIVAWPAAAAACSCLAAAINGSDPVDGASDVPLNQALIVIGHMKPESVRLEDARGTAVEFELEHGPSPGCAGTWAELRPKQPLVAMTGYTVHVGPSATITDATVESFSFTTGAQVLPERTLAVPKVRASVIENIPPTGQSCGAGAIQACVALQDEKDVEMIARQGDRIISRWIWQSKEGNYAFDVVPDCLEFRRRAATGQRSEPLKICGAELGLRPHRASDGDPSFLVCHDGVFGRSDASVTGAPIAPASDAGVSSSTNDAALATADSHAALDTVKTGAADDTADSSASSDGCSLQPSGSGPAWASSLTLLLAALTWRSRARHRACSR